MRWINSNDDEKCANRFICFSFDSFLEIVMKRQFPWHIELDQIGNRIWTLINFSRFLFQSNPIHSIPFKWHWSRYHHHTIYHNKLSKEWEVVEYEKVFARQIHPEHHTILTGPSKYWIFTLDYFFIRSGKNWIGKQKLVRWNGNQCETQTLKITEIFETVLYGQ